MATTVTPATFKTRFPEFDSVADARIQLFIDDSVVILNESFWGAKYDLGIYYLTAHYLTLAEKSESGGTSGTSGAISSRSVDGTSVTYASITPDDSSEGYYLSTTYGQRYIALRKKLSTGATYV